MSKRRGLMSDKFKEEYAKEIGVYDKVKRDQSWGDVTSRDCGNMVKRAIEVANREADRNK